MIVYNTNLLDITLPSIKGFVTFKGAWNRQQDNDQTALAGTYGTTEISDERWIELCEEFKGTHLIKSGQLFSAKSTQEATKKAEDVEPNGNERVNKKDMVKKGIVQYGSASK